MIHFLRYGTYFLMGLTSGIIGPLFEILSPIFSMDKFQHGLIFAVQMVGTIGFYFLGPVLVKGIGTRGAIGLGIGLCALGIIGFGLSTSYAFILLANLFIGIGFSLADIGVSSLTMQKKASSKGASLSLLHAFFGIGAFFAPLCAYAIKVYQADWRLVLLIISGFAIILAFLPVFLKKDSFTLHQEDSKIDLRKLKLPFLWFGGIFLVFYCGLEWGIGTWFPSFISEMNKADLHIGLLGTSLFWLSFSLGRLTQGFIADKIGLFRACFYALSLSGLCLLLWIILGRESSVIVIFIFGFAISSLYPLLVAILSNKFPSDSRLIASFTAINGSFGTLLWPPLIGLMGDLAGLQSLPFIELGFLAVLFYVFWNLIRQSKKI